MPTLSRCFLRGGLLCLALGMIPGGLILVQKGTGWVPVFWVLLPAHSYFVLVGGLSPCTLGVFYLIFPPLGGRAPRSNTTLAWCSYAMLNAALGLVVLHPLLQVLYGDIAANVAFASAGTLQGLAALTFVWHIWPRMRPSATVD